LNIGGAEGERNWASAANVNVKNNHRERKNMM